ncbi:MAG: hypothetical protein HFG02_04780 [Oscillibacter sp.]|nr:hypothetical protein [Oscillibacter sp.]
MLADCAAQRPGEARPRIPGRWLAAAGFALGSAANTEQLLDMGVEMGATVESGGVRFEMLDAIFDGQTVMISVRMSVLDPELREKLKKSDGTLLIMDPPLFPEEGETEDPPLACSYHTLEEVEDLEEGQYDLILLVGWHGVPFRRISGGLPGPAGPGAGGVYSPLRSGHLLGGVGPAGKETCKNARRRHKRNPERLFWIPLVPGGDLW